MSSEFPNLIFIATKKLEFRTHAVKRPKNHVKSMATSQDSAADTCEPIAVFTQQETLENKKFKKSTFHFFKKQLYSDIIDVQ